MGCFIIGLSRLRADLEIHNSSYWDHLVTSLKDSIAEDIVKLQQYIDLTVSTLTKQPATVEEIFENGASHASITTTTSEVRITIFCVPSTAKYNVLDGICLQRTNAKVSDAFQLDEGKCGCS